MEDLFQYPVGKEMQFEQAKKGDAAALALFNKVDSGPELFVLCTVYSHFPDRLASITNNATQQDWTKFLIEMRSLMQQRSITAGRTQQLFDLLHKSYTSISESYCHALTWFDTAVEALSKSLITLEQLCLACPFESSLLESKLFITQLVTFKLAEPLNQLVMHAAATPRTLAIVRELAENNQSNFEIIYREIVRLVQIGQVEADKSLLSRMGASDYLQQCYSIEATRCARLLGADSRESELHLTKLQGYVSKNNPVAFVHLNAYYFTQAQGWCKLAVEESRNSLPWGKPNLELLNNKQLDKFPAVHYWRGRYWEQQPESILTRAPRKLAFECYLKAVESPSCAQAHLALAECYAAGQGTTQDLNKAMHHYYLAATMGDTEKAVSALSGSTFSLGASRTLRSACYQAMLTGDLANSSLKQAMTQESVHLKAVITELVEIRDYDIHMRLGLLQTAAECDPKLVSLFSKQIINEIKSHGNDLQQTAKFLTTLLSYLDLQYFPAIVESLFETPLSLEVRVLLLMLAEKLLQELTPSLKMFLVTTGDFARAKLDDTLQQILTELGQVIAPKDDWPVKHAFIVQKMNRVNTEDAKRSLRDPHTGQLLHNPVLGEDGVTYNGETFGTHKYSFFFSNLPLKSTGIANLKKRAKVAAYLDQKEEVDGEQKFIVPLK